MIRVAQATENDLPQVLEIMREAISPVWTSKALLSEIHKGDSHFIVAVDEAIVDACAVVGEADEPTPCVTAVVGFAVIRQVGTDGELLQIAVDKSARGRGVGDLLMGASLDYAKDNALDSVFLEVRGSNTAAVGLYEKHGFKPVRTRKDYYDSPVEDALVMTRGIVR